MFAPFFLKKRLVSEDKGALHFVQPHKVKRRVEGSSTDSEAALLFSSPMLRRREAFLVIRKEELCARISISLEIFS